MQLGQQSLPEGTCARAAAGDAGLRRARKSHVGDLGQTMPCHLRPYPGCLIRRSAGPSHDRYQPQPWRADLVHLSASVCFICACRRLPSVRSCGQKSVTCEDCGSLLILGFMNHFSHSGQTAVTAIAVQFSYALSYGEVSWQQRSTRAVGTLFSRITKSQIRLTALQPNAKTSDDKTGIERSKSLSSSGASAWIHES